MILRKWTTILVAAASLGLGGLSTINAQNSNLLNDPSFETTETYKRVTIDTDGTYYDVPPAWDGWVMPRSASDPEWKNRVPTGFPHTALFKIDGSRSFSISRGYSSFTAAVFQSVTVPEKANVKGSARGFMERGNQGEATPGGQFRVGIDPNGGSNPLDPAIVWSNWAANDDAWVQLSAEATATGTRVTLFLYATQTEPANPNSMYWDDASLKVGGDGGTATGGGGGTPATPVVPTPAFANFVVPQAPQADGSIVHIVQPGDTLAAIAVAYGTTNDAILTLNNLTSGRFLQIGQRLIIRMAAPGGSSSSDVEAAQGTSQVEPASTDEVATGTEEASTTEEALTGTEEVTTATEEAAPLETAQVAPPTVAVVIPTATELPPAPVTQVAENRDNGASVTSVCLMLFDDANQDRIREGTEALLANGIITVSSNGETVKTYTTDGASEPLCLTDLVAGLYVAAAQPPDGYGMTTSAQLKVNIQTGSSIKVNFGAAQGVEAAVPPAADSGNTQPQAIIDETASTVETSALIQNIGLIVFGMAGFVLVFGLGAAIVLRRR